MEDLIKEFLGQRSFAVAGSFKNNSKFAYRILLGLLSKGREVYAVNPNMSEVEGRPCFKSLTDIPYEVGAVSIVTPPAVTERIVRDCLKKGVKMVWFQPGAESIDAINFCQDNGIKVIYNVCILLNNV